jgi:hypothetical protein
LMTVHDATGWQDSPYVDITGGGESDGISLPDPIATRL